MEETQEEIIRKLRKELLRYQLDSAMRTDAAGLVKYLEEEAKCNPEQTAQARQAIKEALKEKDDNKQGLL